VTMPSERDEHALRDAWHVVGEHVIETAIFRTMIDDVFYRAGGFDAVTCPGGLSLP